MSETLKEKIARLKQEAEAAEQAQNEKATTGLPEILPLFVLPNVTLMPTGRLPLNVFEPRYLAMIDDALGKGRFVGLIQQRNEHDIGADPDVFMVGGCGRITSFAESEGGNYLVSLFGISRFKIIKELPKHEHGYRLALVDWQPYQRDVSAYAGDEKIDRSRLFVVIRKYFRQKNIAVNWDVIQDTSDAELITSLCMTCPFSTGERQALLEAERLKDRADLLYTLLEMAALDHEEAETIRH